MARRRKKKQRGIVLLMVVSLLVLFVLITVTFAMVATQYCNTARILARIQ